MKRYMEKVRAAAARVHRFVTHDVWHPTLPWDESESLLVRQTRVLVVVFKGVFDDDILLRASALTFASMLAIVPLLMSVFYVMQALDMEATINSILRSPTIEPFVETRHFDLEAEVKQFIKNQVFHGVAQEEMLAAPDELNGEELIDPVDLVFEYAKNLATAGEGPKTLPIWAVLFVVTAVFGLLSNIESSFNRIWGTRRTRSRYRMYSDYIAVLLLIPLFVAAVMTATALLHSPRITDMLGPLSYLLLLGRYAVVWLLFTVVYVMVPNTEVRWRHAFVAGVAGGLLWILLSTGYVHFQFGLRRFSFLFSTFAQVPMLLMWIYASWAIVLFGAELAFAMQNEKTFLMERLAEDASYAYREAVAVQAMLELARRFNTGEGGLCPEEFSQRCRIPMRILNDTMSGLEDAGMVVRQAGDRKIFQHAVSPERLTLGAVVKALRETGKEPSDLRLEKPFAELATAMTGLDRPPMNATLSSLAQEVMPCEPATAESGDDEQDTTEGDAG